MQLFLLILIIALLCTGIAIMFFFSGKNGFTKPRHWVLNRQENKIVNFAVACIGVGILLLLMTGNM